uniref:HDC16126 n=1 Tax=Drosophila melanogaster TaxID=7227 RepID=Q6IJ20_DROME|nr:TPA_inf: HDC16126 [Drosophila melanogaster]
MKFTAGGQQPLPIDHRPSPIEKGNQQHNDVTKVQLSGLGSGLRLGSGLGSSMEFGLGMVMVARGTGCQMLAHFMGGRATWRIRKRKRTSGSKEYPPTQKNPANDLN